jgi:hypothetical protein
MRLLEFSSSSGFSPGGREMLSNGKRQQFLQWSKTKGNWGRILFGSFLAALGFAGPAFGGSVKPVDHSKGIQFQRPPLRFEINEGQIDPWVRFMARDRDGVAYLTSDGAVFQIARSVGSAELKPRFKKASYTSETRLFESSFVRMKTVGANPNPRVIGLDRLPGVTNYFIGNDPAKWRTNVSGYAKVKYEGVYPGIDLVYYDNGEGGLEYDFIVAPNADPKQIALSIQDAQSVEVDPSGDLVISAATGTIRKPAPKVYQEIDGKRQEIAAGYRLLDPRHSSLSTRHSSPRPSTLAPQLVAFALGAYDPNKPLVIDPQILYATYLGGSSTSTVANEGARGVAVDAQGSVYVVGVTISTNFPTKNPAQNVLKGFSNAFVTKLDANGQLVYSTYLGGSGFDEGTVIKVDDTGAAYVGGTTGSIDFPTVNPALSRGGRNDGFITKLSPSGSQIVYSTYLGGTDNDSVADLAIDAQKNVFVVGNIAPALGVPANDFPTVNPIQATHAGGVRDGFTSIIDASGSLRFSTYLGGDGDDFFQSLNVNPFNGTVYLTFFSNSTNFPNGSSSLVTPQAAGRPKSGRMKLDLNNYKDYLFMVGRAEEEFINDPSLDEFYKGEVEYYVDVYAKGIIAAARNERNTSNELPPTLANAEQLQTLGGLDVRLSSVDENLNITKHIFFGGSGEDTVSALALKGAVYITGNTRSTDLPVVNPIQATPSGGNTSFEGFLAVFAPGTLQPVFATYLGGTGMEFLNGVTVDAQGNIYVVGETFGGFPNPTPGAIQPQLSGRTDAFIIKISPVEIPDDVLLVSSVLPSSRSVQVGTPATAFATMINAGQSTATSCSVAPITNIPANFLYQTTDPATNQVIGTPNTAVNVAGGAAQSYVLAFTPTAAFPPTDVQLSFDCTNSNPAPVNSGLNTLLLSASNTPVPDIVALAAANAGIVDIPGTNGTGVFAVATVNVGASAGITASADTGTAVLPVNVFLCETNPANGQCISGIGPSVSTTINANATPTFGIFVQGNGNVPFDPAGNRIFVRFKDGGGVTRGSTSVAVRTQ